jgi:tetratricopeptide (TPR) repeat protein
MIAGLLALVTIAAYWPSTGDDFVNLDDPDYVTSNIHVQAGLTWESVKWACSSLVCCNWHPLTVWSHMLDCQLFGLKPWGHHLTSVLLHAVNAALVFGLLQLMTGATWRSLTVAALFGLHPLRVESVAWVAERKDLLSGFFGLLTLIAYARYADGRRQNAERGNLLSESVARRAVPGSTFDVRRSVFAVRPSPPLSPAAGRFWYWTAVLLFALGLMSKPMLVTWPFVMLLLDYWPLARLQLKTKNSKSRTLTALLLEKLPFFILSALSCVVTMVVQRRAMTAVEGLPVAARAGNAVISYRRYLGKLFHPTALAVHYPHPGHWPLAQVMLAGGAILGLSVLIWMQRRRFPYLLVGWLWFVGTLVPVIGLVQVGAQAMADRYTYLPSLGVIVLAVWGISDLARGWRQRGFVLSAASGAAILFCLVSTREQLGYWKESETLFRHALAVTRENWLAHINLGIALHDNGQLDAALSQLQEAVRLKPNHADACSNLGVALDEKGQTDEAIRQLQKAIRLRPDHVDAHYNLGNALAKQGQTDEAIRQFQEALHLKPDSPNIHNNLGLALARQRQTDEAIRQFQEALRLQPGHANAHLNLGNALAGKGQWDAAISQFQEVVRLEPNYAQAHYNLGVVLSRKGQLDEAIRQFKEAVRLKPDFAEAQNNLRYLLGEHPEGLAATAASLDSQGQYADAIRLYQAALKTQPDQAGILNNLAWLLATCPDPAFRNGPEAVRLATRACELSGYTKPQLIGTLAAAQAEAGDFPAAIAAAERAAALATTLGQEKVAVKNQELLQLYRQGQPFHQTQLTTDGHK